MNKKLVSLTISSLLVLSNGINIPGVYAEGNTKLNQTINSSQNNKIVTEFKELAGSNRFETAAKISAQWDQSDFAVITNAYSLTDSLAASPLAASYESPVLLSEKGKLNDVTKKELKRLNTEVVCLIGGENVLDKNVEKELNDMGIRTIRIAGNNRFETSVEIAKHISKNFIVHNIAIVNGVKGLADAVSISPIASRRYMPIILSDKDVLPSGIDFIESKKDNIYNTYIIGGQSSLSDNLVNIINKVLYRPATRISGSCREETNLNIIKKFYPSNVFNTLFVSKNGEKKEDDLVDSLAIGSLAGISNSPVLLVGNKLKDYQKEFISNGSFRNIVKIGGNGNENAFNQMKSIITNK